MSFSENRQVRFSFHRRKFAAALWLLLGGSLLAQKGEFEVTPVPEEVRQYLGLADSHQKRVSVGDFSVLGSKRVSDFALKEAAFLIRRMIGKRDDLLTALNQNKTRFVIMARDEYTTGVPEHSDLRPTIFWDQKGPRFGSYGSTTGRELRRRKPALSCGGSLRYGEHPYP